MWAREAVDRVSSEGMVISHHNEIKTEEIDALGNKKLFKWNVKL